MTDEDGMLACQLEEEYAELGGWEAESDASRILQGLASARSCTITTWPPWTPA